MGLRALFLLSLAAAALAAEQQQQPQPQRRPALPPAPAAGAPGVSSNSVLVALLDSRYTELAELVEKALLLQALEDAVGRGSVTILAPRNEALDRDLDPDFRRFLLEPRNLRALQSLLLFHVLPARVRLPVSSSLLTHPTLAGEPLELTVARSRRLAMAAGTGARILWVFLVVVGSNCSLLLPSICYMPHKIHRSHHGAA